MDHRTTCNYNGRNRNYTNQNVFNRTPSEPITAFGKECLLPKEVQTRLMKVGLRLGTSSSVRACMRARARVSACDLLLYHLRATRVS